MKSLTYYLVLLVLKLKGIKKEFSKSPVDYLKLRKEDLKRPNFRVFKPNKVRTFIEEKTVITEISPDNSNNALIIYCHGGAFVSGPAQHHWDTIKKLVSKTNSAVWMVDYPKAPENKIEVISRNIDLVYSKALKEYINHKIILIGDSVGGTLLMSLTQRSIQNSIKLPVQLVLISPVVDASMSNPDIDAIDKIDPMLSLSGVLSAKKMCAGNNGLDDIRMSPINGDFKNFPKTLLFVAEHDITYPDQKVLIEKMYNCNIDLTVIVGKKMPHIWPILPILKEGKRSLKVLIDWINKDNS